MHTIENTIISKIARAAYDVRELSVETIDYASIPLPECDSETGARDTSRFALAQVWE